MLPTSRSLVPSCTTFLRHFIRPTINKSRYSSSPDGSFSCTHTEGKEIQNKPGIKNTFLKMYYRHSEGCSTIGKILLVYSYFSAGLGAATFSGLAGHAIYTNANYSIDYAFIPLAMLTGGVLGSLIGPAAPLFFAAQIFYDKHVQSLKINDQQNNNIP